MAWICLLAAGCLEMVWVTAMKLSDGFTRVGYSVLTVAAMAASVWLLAQAVKTLPMGTAYAVWTGIGALGAVVLGIVIFKEPATAARMFFRGPAARRHHWSEKQRPFERKRPHQRAFLGRLFPRLPWRPEQAGGCAPGR